jgi:hypothetical protein
MKSKYKKKKYNPPQIKSETIYERSSLACAKQQGGKGRCNNSPQFS